MRILSIETSCDETSASVVESKGSAVNVISNITASSASIHASTGGIIPEKAAREQLIWMTPVLVEALVTSEENKMSDDEAPSTLRSEHLLPVLRLERNPSEAPFSGTKGDKYENFKKALNILKTKIDAIAVTNGPGLIGSLLVGVETAKTLAFALGKPIVPVHHLLAHIAANFILENVSTNEIEKSSHNKVLGRSKNNEEIKFPAIGLVISGGHTDLLYFKTFNDFQWLGGTRDDAAGEALDKIGRLLNISYPAGKEIEERAGKNSSKTFSFTSPMMDYPGFDFSFSGLKAEVARKVKDVDLNEENINQICFATQKAIIDVVLDKTIKAAKKYNVKTILLGGGVSANQALKESLTARADNFGIKVFSPSIEYCTDNAAMIGAQALLNYKPVRWESIQTRPELYFS